MLGNFEALALKAFVDNILTVTLHVDPSMLIIKESFEHCLGAEVAFGVSAFQEYGALVLGYEVTEERINERNGCCVRCRRCPNFDNSDGIRRLWISVIQATNCVGQKVIDSGSMDNFEVKIEKDVQPVVQHLINMFLGEKE